MGLGSRMAQADPGREGRGKKEMRKILPVSSCCLLCDSLPQTPLSSTVSSSASSERGTLGF